MSEDEALHLIVLGLKDLQSLQIQLAEKINVRVTSDTPLTPTKVEVSLLSRIDQLRCHLRDMAEKALQIEDLSVNNTKTFMNVIETVTRKLKDISLVDLPPSAD